MPIMRIQEAQNWLDHWESACRDKGMSPDDMASVLFAAASILQYEEGSWLIDICAEAKRKIGCAHEDLSLCLATSGQRLALSRMCDST